MSLYAQDAFSNKKETRVSLYPNPAIEYLEIKLDDSTLEKVEFELHSIIGNQMVIQVREIGEDRYRIPVKEFPTGYYFLVVKDEKTRYKKAIKFLKD